MKINEIVTEEKLRKGSRSSLPNMQSYPKLDNNANPYLAYRFGMELAGSPDIDMPERGPIGSEFTTIGYSDADQKIIDHASKKFGLKRKTHGGKGSAELDAINNTSPVQARGPIKKKSK
jgi:hypothetical protein